MADDAIRKMASQTAVCGCRGCGYNRPSGPQELKLREGEKVVKIRVRLASGKNLVVSCNGSHSVGDIKAHVQFHAGGDSSGEFLLLNGHPPKPLTDLSATVESEKLRGASLIQRMK